MDVGHQLRDARRRRGAAHAAPQRDADAGGLALKRPQHQFAAAHQIESGPVQIGQLVKDQRRHIGHVGDKIALITNQRGKLLAELAILIRLGAFKGRGKE